MIADEGMGDQIEVESRPSASQKHVPSIPLGAGFRLHFTSFRVAQDDRLLSEVEWTVARVERPEELAA